MMAGIFRAQKLDSVGKKNLENHDSENNPKYSIASSLNLMKGFEQFISMSRV